MIRKAEISVSHKHLLLNDFKWSKHHREAEIAIGFRKSAILQSLHLLLLQRMDFLQWINENVHCRRQHPSFRILVSISCTYQFVLILIGMFACLQPMDVLLLILQSMEIAQTLCRME